MLEVENIFMDHLDDRFNALKAELDSIPTWTNRKHFLATQIEQELIAQGYQKDNGHKNKLFLTGGIGTSLLYQVPENKKGKFAAYRGKLVRLVNYGSYHLEVFYFVKALSDDEVLGLKLIPKFPREIREKKLNQPSFWAKALHPTISRELKIKTSYLRRVKGFHRDYSKENTFKIHFLEYYLPKYHPIQKLLSFENLSFSKGLFVCYLTLSLKIHNFDSFTQIQGVDFEVMAVEANNAQYVDWASPRIEDRAIQNYIQVEGFRKQDQAKHSQLEKYVQEFFKQMNTKELEPIKKRLKPFLLGNPKVLKQIRDLFKKLSHHQLVV
jgi:hypothetical protein